MTATEPPRTTATFSRAWPDRFRTVPVSTPSSSARSASRSGTEVADSARIVRSELKPTDRFRISDGSPWTTSRVPASPPTVKSPLIGVARSAPPGTWTWYVARDGEKIPR